MNERIEKLAVEARQYAFGEVENSQDPTEWSTKYYNEMFEQKFAELIVKECINREELLGAIARGWCSEKNSHKTMDPDLALAIFDEVERQIKQQFGVE